MSTRYLFGIAFQYSFNMSKQYREAENFDIAVRHRGGVAGPQQCDIERRYQLVRYSTLIWLYLKYRGNVYRLNYISTLSLTHGCEISIRYHPNIEIQFCPKHRPKISLRYRINIIIRCRNVEFFFQIQYSTNIGIQHHPDIFVRSQCNIEATLIATWVMCITPKLLNQQDFYTKFHEDPKVFNNREKIPPRRRTMVQEK